MPGAKLRGVPRKFEKCLLCFKFWKILIKPLIFLNLLLSPSKVKKTQLDP